MVRLKLILKKLSFLVISLAVLFIFLEISYRVYRYAKFYNEVNNSNDPLLLRHGLKDKLEYSFKPNAKFVLKNGIEYKTNSKGLRDREYSYEKSPSVYRILALGDSLTFGWLEPLDYSYPKLLEKELNIGSKKRYEVMNAGIYGYNTELEYEFLKREGIKYNPDLVILGFVVNDAEPQNAVAINPNIEMERVTFWFPEFVKYRVNLLLEKKFGINDFLSVKSKFYSSHHWESFTPKYEWKKESCLTSLKGMSNLLKKNNISLLVVVFPSLEMQEGKIVTYENYGYYKSINDTIKEFCVEENIDILDLYPYFEGIEVNEVRQQSGHLNGNGNALVADALSVYLKNHLL